jgi:hypothetical protein
MIMLIVMIVNADWLMQEILFADKTPHTLAALARKPTASENPDFSQ